MAGTGRNSSTDIEQKEESRTMPLVAVTLEPHSYSRKLYLESVFFIVNIK